MAQLDIEAYLRDKGCVIRNASAKEINTHCFFHKEDQSKRGRLYVNVDPSMETPGLFHCKVCDQRGWAKDILEYFGDELERNDETESHDNMYHVWNAAADYYAECLQNNPEALQYLRDRGLTDETIEHHRLGWADGTLKSHLNTLGIKSDDILKTGLIKQAGHDALIDRITIPYQVSGNVIQIRGKDIGGKYYTLPGAKARLFNSDVTWGADTIHIMEGEFDAMLASQMGFPAVGLPGANNWQEGWGGYLSGAKRLYLLFDADAPGQQAAEKLLTKLEHARNVVIPVDGADFTDWVVKHGATEHEVASLVRSVKSPLLVTAMDAYEDWLENEGNPNRQGLLLGLDELDRYITPGLLPGQMFIVQAKTGAGKTISLLNMFQRMSMAQPDMKFMFVSLEQTRSEWFERAWRMYRLYEMIQDPQEAQKKALAYWSERIILIDKNKVGAKELRAAVDECQQDFGDPDLIAVDYLGYWARSFKGEQYQRTTDAVMELKAMAKEWKVPIMTPHQVSRKAEAGEEPGLNAARDSGAVEETADFLLSLWAPDQKQEKQGVNTDIEGRKNEVNMRIVKSRHGGVGRKASMQFANYSLVLAPTSDGPLTRRAEDEAGWYKNGGEYEDTFQRHFTGSKAI